MKSERPPAHKQVRLLWNMKRGVKIKCFGNHPLRIEETLYTPSRLTPDPIRLVYKQRLDLIALYPVLGRVKHWVAGDYSMEIPVALEFSGQIKSVKAAPDGYGYLHVALPMATDSMYFSHPWWLYLLSKHLFLPAEAIPLLSSSWFK
jgi:hypothetical protein